MTYEDEPTIRHAIMRRFDPAKGKKGERGIKVCEILVQPHMIENPPFIAVGVLAAIDSEHDGPIVRSYFHLPAEFELRHLHNEIDEIAEQYKSARIDMALNGRMMKFGEQRTMLGTGLRGNWAMYG